MVPGALQDPDAFDIPPGVAYLNCAYMGPLPRAAVAAGRKALERKARPWQIGVADFFEPLERVRAHFARVVGGDADGVCVIPSVSYDVALAAADLPVGPGERIVLARLESLDTGQPIRDSSFTSSMATSPSMADASTTRRPTAVEPVNAILARVGTPGASVRLALNLPRFSGRSCVVARWRASAHKELVLKPDGPRGRR